MLCEAIGIYPQNLSKYLRKESLDSNLLEKFCMYLNIDPASFFDFRPYQKEQGVNVGTIHQDVTGLGDAKVTIGSGEVELMRQLMEEKDKRIALLEKSNRLLETLLENQKARTEGTKSGDE